MMDNIIQETIQYTRQRKIFKQPVLYHQSVRFRLAELQTEVELLRSLVHRATGRGGHRGGLRDHWLSRLQPLLPSLITLAPPVSHVMDAR